MNAIEENIFGKGKEMCRGRVEDAALCRGRGRPCR